MMEIRMNNSMKEMSELMKLNLLNIFILREGESS